MAEYSQPTGWGRERRRGAGQPRVERRQAAEGNWRVTARVAFVDCGDCLPISAAGKSLEQVVEAKRVCACCLVLHGVPTFQQQTRRGVAVTSRAQIRVVRGLGQRGTSLRYGSRAPGDVS